MAKIKVTIEERLSKTVEIEVNDNLSEIEKEEVAEKKATEMYYNEEIVLTSDDFYYKEISVNDGDFIPF